MYNRFGSLDVLMGSTLVPHWFPGCVPHGFHAFGLLRAESLRGQEFLDIIGLTRCGLLAHHTGVPRCSTSCGTPPRLQTIPPHGSHATHHRHLKSERRGR